MQFPQSLNAMPPWEEQPVPFSVRAETEEMGRTAVERLLVLSGAFGLFNASHGFARLQDQPFLYQIPTAHEPAVVQDPAR